VEVVHDATDLEKIEVQPNFCKHIPDKAIPTIAIGDSGIRMTKNVLMKIDAFGCSGTQPRPGTRHRSAVPAAVAVAHGSATARASA